MAVGYRLYKLRETGRVPDAPCAHWLVHILDMRGPPNAPTWTYPTTRTELATFPEASSLKLVEFDQWPQRVGIQVTSKAQGEAVLAHLAKAAPELHPRLYCHAPTDKVRTIDVATP